MRLRPLVLIAIFATLAHAQDGLEARYKKGEKLGKGYFKEVFAVEGRPDLALSIVVRTPEDPDLENYPTTRARIPTLLKDEVDALNKLEAAGVPVAEITEVGTFEGKQAYVGKRYLAANTNDQDWDARSHTLLNETSLADLALIQKKLTDAGLIVRDLQFLVAADGHLVVADPYGLFPASDITKTGYARDQAGTLHKLAEQARTAILAREVAKMPHAASLDAWFEAPKVDATMVRGTNWPKFKEALATYLESGATTDAARRAAQDLRAGKLRITTTDRDIPPGPGEYGLPIDEPFPRLASYVVRAWVRQNETSGGADVIAAAQSVKFLQTKQAPTQLLGFATDPAELVRSIRGHPPADLVERARDILTAREEVRTPGLLERLKEVVRGRADPKDGATER